MLFDEALVWRRRTRGAGGCTSSRISSRTATCTRRGSRPDPNPYPLASSVTSSLALAPNPTPNILRQARLGLLQGRVAEATKALDKLRVDFVMFARSAAAVVL